MSRLLKITFTFSGPNRDADRRAFHADCHMLGAYAWASQAEGYLVTTLSDVEVHARLLTLRKRGDDMISVVQPAAFSLSGENEEVAKLLLHAEAIGAITMTRYSNTMLAVAARGIHEGPWWDGLTAAQAYEQPMLLQSSRHRGALG